MKEPSPAQLEQREWVGAVCAVTGSKRVKHKGLREVACSGCGATLLKWESRIKDVKDHWCSIECRSRYVRQPEVVAARFWSKVDRSGGPDACWPWMAKIDQWGYGVFSPETRVSIHAQRYAFVLEVGPLGDLLACHTCDNPRCCNPAHLFAGTSDDNMKDKIAKGRQRYVSGTDVPGAKLDEEKVREIRRLYRETSLSQRAIGDEFGVVPSVISDIVRGKSWRGVA